MKTVCELNKCAGCMACVNTCTKKAIYIEDSIKYFNAVIDENKCVNCGLCEKVCPQLNIPDKNMPIKWLEGWAENPKIRSHSSSGGVAACITKAFIENGGYVCSCLFDGGDFTFRITDSIEEAKKFAGSKYVKSNPDGIYLKVKKLLKDDRRVMFIGLPCQVAGLINYLQNTNKENLFTVDLICHGTPSVKTLDLFLKQNGVDLKTLKNISFRGTGGMGLNTKGVSLFGTVDAYLLSFLNALNYTENCYSCKFASTDRISDITLGDNWGTDLKDEMPNGVSLILINSDKGKKIIANADLKLKEVDIDKALAANGQLRVPCSAPVQREWFMEKLDSGKMYKSLVRKLYPKLYMRQILKGYAIKLHLKKVRGGGTE